MLEHQTRSAIFRLRQEGHGYRTIARSLGISRTTVKKVLSSKSVAVPPMRREEGAAEYVDRIRELVGTCKGNLVRVHEELAAAGVELSYQALTGFCRKHGIGKQKKQRTGQYHFDPGEEMQHDTSPHDVRVGSATRRLQCASLVLCYSRMQYAQCYTSYTRFSAKLFLTEALVVFGCSAGRCMIDNSNVVIAHGTGKHAVPAPEMKALADRFRFEFEAHEVGDANRSARVERPFHYIENNFYPGRTFADMADLNQQMASWCSTANHRFKRHLHASPVELFAAERSSLADVPIYIPEVYEVHYRIVDVEGYVNLHTNRYSVDDDLIGRRVQLHETKDRIQVFAGHQLSVEHERQEPGARARITLKQHRYCGRWKSNAYRTPIPEEASLRAAGGRMPELVDCIRQHYGGRAVRPLRKLHRMFLEYPLEPLLDAIDAALTYGLTDLVRIEKMVIGNLSGTYFQLPLPKPEEEYE